MSINLSLIAKAECISPSGKKIEVVENYPLLQTTTQNTYLILDAENKIEAYSKIYGGKTKLKSWISKYEKLGFKILWGIE